MQNGLIQLPPNYLISVYADGQHLLNLPEWGETKARLLFHKVKHIIFLNVKYNSGQIILFGKTKSIDFPTRVIETYQLKKQDKNVGNNYNSSSSNFTQNPFDYSPRTANSIK